MNNPFSRQSREQRRAHRDALRARAQAQRAELAQPAKQRLSPDGLRVVEFSAPITSMLRLYGMSSNYAAIYAAQPNVRTAINTVAREAASLTLKTYYKDDRGVEAPTSRIEVEGEDVALLLKEPGGGVYPTSPYDFWFATFADIEIYDIAFFKKIRNGGIPRALVRIPPANITAIREPLTQHITGWRDFNGREYAVEDFVTFWGYDPAVGHGNIPPMESIRRIIAEDIAAGQDREGKWRNSARKDGIIEQDKDARELDDEGTESFLLDVEDSLAGPLGSGRPLMLKPGMKWNDITWSPREMEYINARKLTRLEVAAHFHIPPSMIAAAGNNAEANADTLNYFYKTSLPPRLTRVEDTIEQQLLPEFYRDPVIRRRYYVEFNMDEKLRGSFEERAAIMATTVGGPVVTVNEGRARLNLPATDNPLDDEIYQPLNSLRGGGTQVSPANPNQTPATDAGNLEPAGVTPGGGTDPEKSWDIDDIIRDADQLYADRVAEAEMRARFEERTRGILERTMKRQQNALAGGKEWDMERWNRELGNDMHDMLRSAAGDGFVDVDDKLREFATGVAEYVNSDIVCHGFNGQARYVSANVAAWVSKHHPLQRLREGTTYDEAITRRGVLLRDGWTCAICDKPIEDVPWTAGGDNSLYGTVDHITAVEDGGSHTWDNVQAVHYGCNSGRWYDSRRNPAQGD